MRTYVVVVSWVAAFIYIKVAAEKSYFYEYVWATPNRPYDDDAHGQKDAPFVPSLDYYTDATMTVAPHLTNLQNHNPLSFII